MNDPLVADFISPNSFIVGNIIPTSVKCIHSATETLCLSLHSSPRPPTAAYLCQSYSCAALVADSPEALRVYLLCRFIDRPH